MDSAAWCLALIAQYLTHSRALTQRLCDALKEPDLFLGRREKRIPRTGKTEDGLEFSFHGIGCWISDGTISIDFDFLPGGKLGGFDAWRLYRFSDENPSFRGPRSEDEVQLALEELLKRGLVKAVDGSRLYLPTAAFPSS